MKSILLRMSCFAAVLLSGFVSADAAITYSILTTTSDGEVNAGAVFTLDLTTKTLSIDLANAEKNPTSPGQLLSGIQFTLSGSPTGQQLTVGTGVLINIDSSNGKNGGDGSYTYVNADQSASNLLTTPNGWETTSSPNGITALSGSQPDLMIIGPPDDGDKYSGANGGVDNFNPSALKFAHFELTYTGGLNANTLLQNVKFTFGTKPDHVLSPTSVTGDLVPTVVVTATTPEPASLAVWSVLALAGGAFGRRRKVA